MSVLTIYSDQDASIPLWHSTDGVAIQHQLEAEGVRFERRHTIDLDADSLSTSAAVINAYQHAITKLAAEQHYQSWDVISMTKDHPQKDTLRAQFLNEHTHSEDEVRFFVAGTGLFCLHIGHQIFQVRCEQHDLISVPAATPHWFDMGSEPDFTAIRIFDHPKGWVAHFTGSDIADVYPRLA